MTNQTPAPESATGITLQTKLQRLNAVFAEVQEYKAGHPETKIGYYESSVGSILNAYREGDLTFAECERLLLPATPLPAPMIEAATPRPWESVGTMIVSCDVRDTKPIAVTSDRVAITYMSERPKAECVANAELITAAVNSYSPGRDAALVALNAMEERSGSSAFDVGYNGCLFHVKNILAKPPAAERDAALSEVLQDKRDEYLAKTINVTGETLLRALAQLEAANDVCAAIESAKSEHDALVEQLREALKKTLTCSLTTNVRELVRAALKAYDELKVKK